MKLSVIILTRNEQDRIAQCIKSVSFADEIIVLDDKSTDNTVATARKLGANVYVHHKKDFADQRNIGLSKTHGQWVLYLDADEMISEPLTQEIQDALSNTAYNAYAIPRENYYLGKRWPKVEYLERLFKRDAHNGWFGQVHESPKIIGEVGKLQNPIIHHTHRSLSQMLTKTIEWSVVEAQLRFDANHPAISWWRFPPLMLRTFFDWYIAQGGWRVGTVGLIEGIYQSFSVFITYARLWEMQNKQ